ncbi:hypothetical protein A8C56_03565 [Niabella ginsenosidivorans]|uniref:Uncharacterized protein n=1 Tax=Niabella ginsenosidivorans TaxID=1176587 RepID=A0A1A9I0C4_9BACT|nr:hypothetical protein A8C56_03565 [Niabella ginsenosidivorans]
MKYRQALFQEKLLAAKCVFYQISCFEVLLIFIPIFFFRIRSNFSITIKMLKTSRSYETCFFNRESVL